MKKEKIVNFIKKNFKAIIYSIVFLLIMLFMILTCGYLKNPDGEIIFKLSGFQLIFGLKNKYETFVLFNVVGLLSLIFIIISLIFINIKINKIKFKKCIDLSLLIISSIFNFCMIISPNFSQSVYAKYYDLSIIGFILMIIPLLVTINYFYFNFIRKESK